METRRIVLEILLEYEKEGTMLRPLLSSVLTKYAYLERRDRAFIKTLCEGVVERQMSLDYVIDQAASIKTSKMKGTIRQIIRMGAYQILYMDHVPDSAAVNEAVKLAAWKHMAALKGFVNGVLRGIIRLRDGGISYPDMETEYSCPYPVAAILREDLGDQKAELVIKSLVEHPGLCLRTNAAKITVLELAALLKKEGVEVTDMAGWESGDRTIQSTGDLPPGVLFAKNGGLNPAGSKSFNEGLYIIQDLSSQYAVWDLWKEYVNINHSKMDYINALDMCAAPGGKSLYLAELMGDKGRIDACDISEEKTEKIRENIARMGVSNIDTAIRDAAVYDGSLDERYDIIIADLPCSGLGVMGRKVDIKYRVSPEGIDSLCKLQREMADNAVRYLKPGGILLYSVCTLTDREGMRQREYLENKGLHKISERKFIQGVDPCDGFYYALMHKQ